MDPQQRILLEETVGAFRQAGRSADALLGSATGVYVGCIWLEYGKLLAAAGNPAGAYMVTGALSFLGIVVQQSRTSHCLQIYLSTHPQCPTACRTSKKKHTPPACRQWAGFHGGACVLLPGPCGALRAHQHRLLLLAGGLPPSGARYPAGDGAERGRRKHDGYLVPTQAQAGVSEVCSTSADPPYHCLLHLQPSRASAAWPQLPA